MQMHKVPSVNMSYRFNAVLNLTTFAGCRGFALLRISYGMYMNPEKMTPFYTVLLGTSMFIMNLLNPVLFYILLRNDFLLPPRDEDLYIKKGMKVNCPPSESKISNGYSLSLEINGFPCDGIHKRNLWKLWMGSVKLIYLFIKIRLLIVCSKLDLLFVIPRHISLPICGLSFDFFIDIFTNINFLMMFSVSILFADCWSVNSRWLLRNYNSVCLDS